MGLPGRATTLTRKLNFGKLEVWLPSCVGAVGRTVGISLEHVHRVGPETLCTDFREIWTKYVGTGAKSVF